MLQTTIKQEIASNRKLTRALLFNNQTGPNCVCMGNRNRDAQEVNDVRITDVI